MIKQNYDNINMKHSLEELVGKLKGMYIVEPSHDLDIYPISGVHSLYTDMVIVQYIGKHEKVNEIHLITSDLLNLLDTDSFNIGDELEDGFTVSKKIIYYDCLSYVYEIENKDGGTRKVFKSKE